MISAFTHETLFHRKIDCDIRIQLPQVSKEHCRVEINENKEVNDCFFTYILIKFQLKEFCKQCYILCVYVCCFKVVLTNLSSVNPTCINGVPMQQSERLKHGDVFTVIDRSFR